MGPTGGVGIEGDAAGASTFDGSIRATGGCLLAEFESSWQSKSDLWPGESFLPRFGMNMVYREVRPANKPCVVSGLPVTGWSYRSNPWEF
jgi:hypothetical protein